MVSFVVTSRTVGVFLLSREGQVANHRVRQRTPYLLNKMFSTKSTTQILKHLHVQKTLWWLTSDMQTRYVAVSVVTDRERHMDKASTITPWHICWGLIISWLIHYNKCKLRFQHDCVAVTGYDYKYTSSIFTVLSHSKIQGMTRKHGLGRACSHMDSPTPTSKEVLYLWLVGLTCLTYARRTLI